MTDTKLVAGSTLANTRALRRIVRELGEMDRDGVIERASVAWPLRIVDALRAVSVARIHGTSDLRTALACLGALVVAWLAAMEEQK